MKGYTKILNNFVNAVYRTAKPFTTKLGDGVLIDDAISRAMLAAAESFKDDNLQFTAAAFSPQAAESDRAAVDNTLYAIVFNVMYLLDKWAELCGDTARPDADALADQVGMIDAVSQGSGAI